MSHFSGQPVKHVCRSRKSVPYILLHFILQFILCIFNRFSEQFTAAPGPGSVPVWIASRASIAHLGPKDKLSRCAPSAGCPSVSGRRRSWAAGGRPRRVGLAFAFSRTSLGATAIWFAWPVGWTIACVLSILFYRTGPWNHKDQQEASAA